MRLVFLSCCLLVALTACGKKPGFVDAPLYDANGNRLSYGDINGPDGKPDTKDHKDGIKPVKRKDSFPNIYPQPWL